MIAGARTEAPGATRARSLLLALGLVLALGVVGFLAVDARLSGGEAAPALAPDPLEAAAVRAEAAAAATVAPKTAVPAEFERVTGIEILRVAVTADGGLLDLRYRVLDPEKVSSHNVHGHLIGVSYGTGDGLLTDSFHGPGHGQHLPDVPRAGQGYYMLFLNPAGVVEPGDEVGIRLGHSELTGVTVG